MKRAWLELRRLLAAKLAGMALDLTPIEDRKTLVAFLNLFKAMGDER